MSRRLVGCRIAQLTLIQQQRCSPCHSTHCPTGRNAVFVLPCWLIGGQWPGVIVINGNGALRKAAVPQPLNRMAIGNGCKRQADIAETLTSCDPVRVVVIGWLVQNCHCKLKGHKFTLFKHVYTDFRCAVQASYVNKLLFFGCTQNMATFRVHYACIMSVLYEHFMMR